MFSLSISKSFVIRYRDITISDLLAAHTKRYRYQIYISLCTAIEFHKALYTISPRTDLVWSVTGYRERVESVTTTAVIICHAFHFQQNGKAPWNCYKKRNRYTWNRKQCWTGSRNWGGVFGAAALPTRGRRRTTSPLPVVIITKVYTGSLTRYALARTFSVTGSKKRE